jgi:choline-sulfatase
MRAERRQLLASLAGFALPARSRAQTRSASRRKPNLLFIMADQLSVHALGYAGNGSVRTPNLDRLARQGARFTDSDCASPVCVPSRHSILTGKYPHSNGVFSNTHVLDEREVTIAQKFREAGYLTAAIGKMHFLDNNLRHGFDQHVEFGTEEGAALMPEIRGDPRFAYDQRIYSQIRPAVLRGGPASNWAEEAVAAYTRKFLADARDRPFCAWVSFGLPHWHWVCGPEFYYLYDPGKIALPVSFRDDLSNSPYARNVSRSAGFYEMNEEQTRLCLARYYGAVTAMDHYVGQVLDELDRLGLAGNTLVVFTADHGEMAGEHKLWDKSVFYEASVRTPLTLRWPGVIPAGREATGLISHIDLFPSLASLCGVAAERTGEGQDFSALITGKNETGRDYLFSELDLNDDDGQPNAILVRWKDWAYFHYSKSPDELYNLKSDPEQLTSRTKDPAAAGVLADLRARAESFSSDRARPSYPVRRSPLTHPLTRQRKF